MWIGGLKYYRTEKCVNEMSQELVSSKSVKCVVAKFISHHKYESVCSFSECNLKNKHCYEKKLISSKKQNFINCTKYCAR